MSSSIHGRTRRLAVVLAIGLAVAIIPTGVSAEEPEPSITFAGAGWGHGVGMSQYGAYGRAIEGQTYDEIVRSYYTDLTNPSLTQIGSLGIGGIPDPGTIFTNVGSDVTSTMLTVGNGPASGDGVTIIRETGEAVPPAAELTAGDRVTVVDTTPEPGNPGGCEITLTIDGVDTVWEAGSCDLTIELTDGATEPTNLVSATNCRRPADCTYGYGTFRTVDNGSTQRTFADRIGSSGCSTCPVYQGFDLVVEATLDDYTRGIAEVPFSWPTEALKTQAVAARSYAASFAIASNPNTDHRSKGCFCDLRNDSSDQVYAGWVAGRQQASRWDTAATTTTGQVVTHPAAPDQGIVRAYYSSSNGGATEWVKEKWGGDLPYLVSIPDPWSLTSANPLASWTFAYSADEVVDEVWGTSVDYTLIDAQVIARHVSGSADIVRFRALNALDETISRDLSSGVVASRFDLPSWYFDVGDDALVVPPPRESDGVAVQDPRSGIWTLRDTRGAVTSFYYGNPLDIPFIGDWDGDGVQTVGLYRESRGYLFLRNSNTQGIADIEIFYGDPGDLPVAGDWNNDGTDTVGIYRRSDNAFYLRNSNTQGIANVVIPFGNPGDVPLAGDWDGDGYDTIGVYRPSTRMVYLVNDLSASVPDVVFEYTGAASGDRIVTGDWNDDGIDTVGVFRPSNATWYLRDTFTQTSANIVFEFGDTWTNPIAGYWGP